VLLTINELSKSFGDRTVLSRVSLTLDGGQKIGLVGANGAGKTTLLKIIVGDVEADQGTVEIGRDVRIGYLPQTLAQAAGESIDAFINRVLGDLRGLEREMRRLEARMGAGGPELEALLANYARLQARFERQGGYELAHPSGRPPSTQCRRNRPPRPAQSSGRWSRYRESRSRTGNSRNTRR